MIRTPRPPSASPLSPKYSSRYLGEVGELVNFKWLQLTQYIMFCGWWGESCSQVHWTAYMAVFACFWSFITICTYLFISEVVNIYELYDDSMCQFAMSTVNK